MTNSHNPDGSRLRWEKTYDQILHNDRLAGELGGFYLKAMITVNAGALVALVALIANLDETSARSDQIYPAALGAAWWFIGGLISAIFASTLAYFYQSSVTASLFHNLDKISEVPEPRFGWASRVSRVATIPMVISALGAAVCFGIGAVDFLIDMSGCDTQTVTPTASTTCAVVCAFGRACNGGRLMTLADGIADAERLVSMATDIIQALAVVIAAWIGGQGLHAWRRQMVGKKRVDLAEDTLVKANEVFNSIGGVRNPFAFGGEGDSRPPKSGETEALRSERNGFFVPIERLRSVGDQFEKLWSLRTRCKVHFGLEVVTPIDVLLKAQTKIASAAQALIRTAGRLEPRTAEQENQRMAQIQRWEDIIWDAGSDDEPNELTVALRDALTSLEGKLQPYLKDK